MSDTHLELASDALGTPAGDQSAVYDLATIGLIVLTTVELPGGGGRGLPKIRGTQVGLRNPALIDTLKLAMRTGTYEFSAPRGANQRRPGS